jgi:hypothetical protein
MNILRTAQVCVIDDEPKEYRRLLHALNSLGLGCVHVPGDKVEELPAEPFRGLRLVFLDMHLGTIGGTDERAVTAHTAHVFSCVVSPESAPIVVIVWTKYANLIASFRASLFEVYPGFRGRLFFIRLDKPQPPACIDIEKLLQDVERELSQLHPLPLLWNWDALVQRAACGVAAELCRLAAAQAQLAAADNEEQERTKMLSALSSVLRLLLKAEAGKAASPEIAALTLLNVLGPLHSDRLENLSPKPELDSAAALLEAEADPVAPAEEVVVALNTMLLTGASHVDGNSFRPGTMYHIADADDFSAATGFSITGIAAKLCQKDLLKEENAARFQAWIEACRPVLLEISPACDFAQQKRPIARLIGGLLVPKGVEKQIKEHPEEGYSALRDLGFVKIPALDQGTNWHPVFSSAVVLSWPEGVAAPFLTPVARLKEPVLSDLRNWLSSQGARLGYLFVDTRV